MRKMAAKRKSNRAKVAAHRRRLRAKGLRPIQFWVPDVHSPEFAKLAHQWSLKIANSPHEKEEQAFIDALAEGFWD